MAKTWPIRWKIGQIGGKMAEMAGTAKKWPKNCYNGQKMAKMVEKWPKWLKMAKIVGKWPK